MRSQRVLFQRCFRQRKPVLEGEWKISLIKNERCDGRLKRNLTEYSKELGCWHLGWVDGLVWLPTSQLVLCSLWVFTQHYRQVFLI